MNGLQDRSTERGVSSRISSVIHLDTPVTDPVGSKETSQIQRTMSSILSSVQFRSSKQCQDLLRYVIEQSLNDQNDLLRERVIGAMVFGRRPDYDTANDPIVRARMAEVRKRLAQYYQSENFDSSQTRIEIPPGHYRAIFRLGTSPVSAATEETVAERVNPPAAVIPVLQGPDVDAVAAESTWIFRVHRRIDRLGCGRLLVRDTGHKFHRIRKRRQILEAVGVRFVLYR